jgi:hypothetical protein
MGLRKTVLRLVLLLVGTGPVVAENFLIDTGNVRVVAVPHGGKVPDAEVDNNGVIHLTYLKDTNTYYTRTEDQGKSFSEPLRVNSEDGFASGARFRGPDLAIGKENRIHVIWYNAGYQQKRPKGQWGVMYSRLTKNGSSFESSRNLNHKPSDNFSLAVDRHDRVAVIWMAGGIFVNLSSDGGDHFASPHNLGADPCECCGSRAVYSPNGMLTVLYRNKTNNIRDTYLADLPKGATSFRHTKLSQTPWKINACPMTGSFLSVNGSSLSAAWRTKEQICYSHVDREHPNALSQEKIAVEQGRYPVILEGSNGKKLLAWKNGLNLEWTVFNRKGNPIQSPNSVTCRHPDRPSGVKISDGKFVLFP